MKLINIVEPSVLKYVLSGGCAFAVEYAVFYLLFAILDMSLYIANSASFTTGLLVSFTLNRNWTFGQGEYRHKGHRQLMMYAALALGNLVLTNILIGVLNHMGIAALAAKLIAMGMIVIWNFLIFKAFIFAKK